MTGARWAAERAVELRRAADVVLAIADDTTAAHLRWAANALTTNGFTRGSRLTVIAVAGDSVGVVSQQGGLDEDSVHTLVRAAERTARQSLPAPDAAPLPANPGSWDHRPPAETTFAELAKIVPPLAAAFDHAADRHRLLYGYAEHQVRTSYLASSTGLRLRHTQPTGILDLTAKTADHAASTWAGRTVPDFGAIDPAALAGQLDERLSWSARRVELPVGRYEVLLPPSCVADLMVNLYDTASRRDAVAGHSVFSAPGGGTRIGERLTDAAVTLYSDPAEPGLECAPFGLARALGPLASVFDNGLPLRRTDWIDNGVLTALVQARRTPRIDNLVLTGDRPGRTLPELIAGTRRGLLLTSLWYLRDVDLRTLLLTGLTRDGVYLVENGEVVGATHNFRFNESPVSLLGRITETGRTEPALPREWGDYFTRVAMPALRIPDFDLSSISRSP